MKKQGADKFWNAAAELFPESLELIREAKRDLEGSRIPASPRAPNVCENWTHAWLYILRCTDLHSTQHLKFEGEKVVRAVLIGEEFDEKILDLLMGFRERLGVDRELRELRLIDTEFLNRHLEFLRGLFPSAKVKLLSYEEWQANLDLGSAGYGINHGVE